MFLLDGKPLAVDTPFTANDIQYPANWLRLASAEEKASVGISEVPDPQPYDDRFYWGPENPKDLQTLKTNLVSQIKSTANSLLSATDWKIVRAAEGIKAVDQETLEFREAVREASNANEVSVTSCTTVDELAALQFTWPNQGGV